MNRVCCCTAIWEVDSFRVNTRDRKPPKLPSFAQLPPPLTYIVEHEISPFCSLHMCEKKTCNIGPYIVHIPYLLEYAIPPKNNYYVLLITFQW